MLYSDIPIFSGCAGYYGAQIVIEITNLNDVDPDRLC